MSSIVLLTCKSFAFTSVEFNCIFWKNPQGYCILKYIFNLPHVLLSSSHLILDWHVLMLSVCLVLPKLHLPSCVERIRMLLLGCWVCYFFSFDWILLGQLCMLGHCQAPISFPLWKKDYTKILSNDTYLCLHHCHSNSLIEKIPVLGGSYSC